MGNGFEFLHESQSEPWVEIFILAQNEINGFTFHMLVSTLISFDVAKSSFCCCSCRWWNWNSIKETHVVISRTKSWVTFLLLWKVHDVTFACTNEILTRTWLVLVKVQTKFFPLQNRDKQENPETALPVDTISELFIIISWCFPYPFSMKYWSFTRNASNKILRFNH